MDISFEQRQLLNSLYKHGYIGNWNKSPNEIFLKVYLAEEEKDVYMRIQFDIRLNVIDMLFDDPTVLLFQKSKFEDKFLNLIQAIKEISPDAFKNYAIPVKDVDDFDFESRDGAIAGK
jgi:hypothetical protein